MPFLPEGQSGAIELTSAASPLRRVGADQDVAAESMILFSPWGSTWPNTQTSSDQKQ